MLIIRPSGIWNSRAPLNDYIQQDRAISKSAATQTLALYRLREALEAEPNKERSGRQLFESITKGKAAGGKAWLQYRRSHGNDLDGRAIQPKVTHLLNDSFLALADVQEMAVIRLSSMFESYAQCWALNFLLASLEGGLVLSKRETSLVDAFLPAFSRGHVPSWPTIIGAYPTVKERLVALPHLSTNPLTGEELTEPLESSLNAHTAIQFWRAYRNLAVHLSRLVTRSFHAKYSEFFRRTTAHFGYIRVLEPGQPLPLKDDLFGAMAATHYRAALLLNELLEERSAGRRGHPEAPRPKETVFWDAPPRSPPLLLLGDHAESLRWVTDTSFRIEESLRRGWRVDAQPVVPADSATAAPLRSR